VSARESIMPWRKVGRIVALEPSGLRSTNHMQGPVAIVLGNSIRIFFAARTSNGKSYPAYVDVDKSNPQKVTDVHEQPIMPFGPTGTFDDEGIMPACVLPVNGILRMYYSGWNRRTTIPCHNTTGMATSYDNGNTFQRDFDGPILERTPHEPYMAVTPWVMREDDNWRMWYVSGISWPRIGESLEPVYVIKYADSHDGINWRRPNLLAVPQRHAMEAMARPTVVRRGGSYHMWFCYRDSIDFRDGKGSYRIGYAQSMDGYTWKRNDQMAGIAASNDGWDSTMLCYPYVIEVGGELIMFHNGNSFGQTGIGYAIWEGALP
jgi:hypothetical protein